MGKVTEVKSVKEARNLFIVRLGLERPDTELDEVLEMYHKYKCDLAVVGNRRELLKAFKWFRDYWPEEISLEKAVEHFLENKSNL